MAALKLELISFAGCKNENYSDLTVRSWINEFECMRMTAFEVIKRIRMAKHEKKFGVTEFAIFMNVDLSDYGDLYKHSAIKKGNTTSFKYAIPQTDIPGLKKGEYYEIISETETEVVLQTSTHGMGNYLKENFGFSNSVFEAAREFIKSSSEFLSSENNNSYS